MIEKMKFLSFTGHKDDIDRVIDQYLSRYDIQFENALSELKTVKGLRPFMETNPYKEVFQTATQLAEALSGDSASFSPDSMTVEKAAEITKSLDSQLASLKKEKEELLQEAEALKASLDKISHFTAKSCILSTSNSALAALKKNIFRNSASMFMIL